MSLMQQESALRDCQGESVHEVFEIRVGLVYWKQEQAEQAARGLLTQALEDQEIRL